MVDPLPEGRGLAKKDKELSKEIAGDSGRDSKFLREVGKEVKTWIMG